MESEPRKYKPGQAVMLGVVLGGFIGLLVGKFAIGMIAGFFVGLAIDGSRRKAAGARGESSPDNGEKN